MRLPSWDSPQTQSIAPAQQIRDTSYDLSFNRYHEAEHDETVYEDPKIILQKLKTLEDKIQQGIGELEEMLG